VLADLISVPAWVWIRACARS